MYMFFSYELNWLRYVMRIDCTIEEKICLLISNGTRTLSQSAMTLNSFIYFFDHLVLSIKNWNEARISRHNHVFSMSKIFVCLSSCQWFKKLPSFSTSTFNYIYGDFLHLVCPISTNVHSLEREFMIFNFDSYLVFEKVHNYVVNWWKRGKSDRI